MSNSENSNNNNKFSNGFFLGALLGVGGALLLGTKKGRRVLKTIVDEGKEQIEEFSEKIGEQKVTEEDVPQKKSSKSSPHITSMLDEQEQDMDVSDLAEMLGEKVDHTTQKIDELAKDASKTVMDLEKKGKRFFKKIPKKLSN